jgi:hypothetical protein
LQNIIKGAQEIEKIRFTTGYDQARFIAGAWSKDHGEMEFPWEVKTENTTLEELDQFMNDMQQFIPKKYE